MEKQLESVHRFLEKNRELLVEQKKPKFAEQLTLLQRMTDEPSNSRKKRRVIGPEETFDLPDFGKTVRDRIFSKMDYAELAVMESTCQEVHNQLARKVVPYQNKLRIYEISMTDENQFFARIDKDHDQVDLAAFLANKPQSVHIEAERICLEVDWRNIHGEKDTLLAMLDAVTSNHVYFKTGYNKDYLEVVTKVGAKSLEIRGSNVDGVFFMEPEIQSLERFESNQCIDVTLETFRQIRIPTVIASLPQQAIVSKYLSALLENWRSGVQDIRFIALRDISSASIWDISATFKKERLTKFNRTTTSFLRNYSADCSASFVVKRGREEKSNDFLFILWKNWEIRIGSLEGIIENRKCDRKYL